ncbi:MAG: hypothetical protein J6U68_05070, partial [Clostridia bacterium]|nr:hypothetical protein [Clostridia bacterium]
VAKIEESLTTVDKEDEYFNKKGNDGKNTIKTYKYGYVNVISKTHFAVLSVTTVEDEYQSLRGSGTVAVFGCTKYEFADGADDHAYAKYVLTIYDAEGKAVKTIGEKEFEARCNGNIDGFTQTMYSKLVEDYIPVESKSGVRVSGTDLLIDGTKVYRDDMKGTVTLVKDYGLSKMPNFHINNSYEFFMKIGEKYLEYRRYNNDNDYAPQYTVYNKDLTAEIVYNVPSNAGGATVNLLANGNLLVQYTLTLNENEETYDIREDATGKYDLKTFIVTKDGATELADVNYLITKSTPALTDLNGQKVYAEKIENLAFIYPIAEDKTLDTSANNVKLVALSNDLKTVNEVICADKLANFPYHIDDNTFAATLASGGTAYYSETGEKISVLGSSVGGKYKYVDGDGIYDIKGVKVYDYKKNNTLAVNACGESFVIKYLSYDDNGAKTNYALFVDGELKSLAATVVGELDLNKEKGVYEEGLYILNTTVTKEDGTEVPNVSYYNEKGTCLGTFAGSAMSHIVSGDVYIVFRSYTENKIYKFTTAVPEAK